MIHNIPGVDRSHLAEWAIAQMYKAMRLAEKAMADYDLNKSIIINSSPGDRSIPRQSDLNTIAGTHQMHVNNANMYAAVFAACELADDSPHSAKYQAAIAAVGASLADKQIPQQRVPAGN